MTAAAGSGPEVRILAPAKINVGLAVCGRRPDGYHELHTIFQAVSLFDRVTVRRRRSGVSVSCPALPGLGAGNLAHRAATLFLRESGAGGGIAVALEKRIPAGGGLGGGSSDAAAVLLGSCRLFGVRPPPQTLAAWAAELGSDVPFFLAGGSAVGRGRGELLDPLPPFGGDCRVLVCAPGRELSTAAVYARVKPAALTSRRAPLTILLARWREGDLRRLGAALFNDLESPAFTMAPELAGIRGALLAAGACGASLSGSGSCLYGLFPGRAEAARALHELRGKVPGRIFQARFLPARARWGVVKR